MAEYLLSRLNIHVSGASEPRRAEPIECFRPYHQSYRSSMNSAVPGASLRKVQSSMGKDGFAIVYDRDIEKAFESALGQETMFVAIEAFMDSEFGHCGGSEMVRRFGEYVDGLGTQPVTVTISSLVEDMLDSYADVTRGLHGFSWKQNLSSLVQEFIYTRECFFYTENRAPVLEATFKIMRYYADELDVDLQFAWSPPVVDFCDLRNVITEGNALYLQPTFTDRPYASRLPMTTEYFIGPGESWLRWDESQECFHGVVPNQIASQVGAERFEAYTVPLELTARITKHFPEGIRFERIVRCALPLTVKRRPSRCARDEYSAASPGIARPTQSRMPVEPRAIFRTPERPESAPTSAPVPREGILTRPPLMRTPFRRLNEQLRQPPTTPRPRIFSCQDKENDRLNMEDVHKLMERKAQSPKSHSPIRLNSLSLARLHDVVALTNPPPSLVDLEVRTVHQVRCDSLQSDKENTPSKAEGSVRRKTVSPAKVASEDTASEVNLGRLHMNRHGKLDSRSESDVRSDSASCISPPTRNITPPVSSKRAALSQRKLEKLPMQPCASQSTAVKDSRPLHDISPNRVESAAVSQAHPTQSRGESAAAPPAPMTPWEAAVKQAIDQWQMAIQQNFKEFESKPSDTMDVTMEDVADSDAELPGSQSGNEE